MGGVSEDVALLDASSFEVFALIKASRHALVTIPALSLEPFREHFGYVFRNRLNLDFHDPSHAKAMI